MMERNRPMSGNVTAASGPKRQGERVGGGAYGMDGACEHTFAYLERF